MNVSKFFLPGSLPFCRAISWPPCFPLLSDGMQWIDVVPRCPGRWTGCRRRMNPQHPNSARLASCLFLINATSFQWEKDPAKCCKKSTDFFQWTSMMTMIGWWINFQLFGSCLRNAFCVFLGEWVSFSSWVVLV